MHRIFTTLLLSILPMTFINAQQKMPSSYVNPFIGTDFHGHTYPGATLPFGMVQLSPDTRLDGWDGCSGYHYSDSLIYGFSHTHLSGTGCLDYGDILVMPTVGEYVFDNNLYSSQFKKETEYAKPGYYSVFLDKPKVKAELTASIRVGFHRYTYPENGKANILIDLSHRDKVLETSIQFVADDEIHGFRRSSSWAGDQRIYFVMKFSSPYNAGEVMVNGKSSVISVSSNTDRQVVNAENIKAALSFNNLPDSVLLVKVGISSVSIEGAKENMNAEIPSWDFDAYVAKADNIWNKELGKITISDESRDNSETFYTALYHCMVVPNIFSDVNGNYLGIDKKVHNAEGYTPYTVFSLWDTYRAWHPLMTIIDTKRTNDYVNTFLSIYKYGGLLPVWELAANETFCMIGYHSVSVIADAWMKGIRGFDAGYALDAMKNSANSNRYGLKDYRSLGYVPADKEHESVSKTLEYAYDDWCIAMLAKGLDKEEDYKTFITRAQFYKNIFDSSTGFMRPRYNGSWKEPFFPTDVDNNFTEANSWQYSFYVPQDISGLIKLHGGKRPFEIKLDELFATNASMTGRDQSDITGVIGQYAHGNEPSHHMTYLYNYIGEPWKTQKLVREILDMMYTNKPDGLCGNEDCGQMSAWYVLSSLGLYSVCPGNTQYVIGSPLFRTAVIHLENGKSFTVKAKNNSKENIYIEKAFFNGKPHKRSWIDYSEIIKGGVLELIMSSKPNMEWASDSSGIPVSKIDNNILVPSPFFNTTTQTFSDSLVLNIGAADSSLRIFHNVTPFGKEYTEDDWTEGRQAVIHESSIVRAYSVDASDKRSFVTEGSFNKFKKDKYISIKNPYHPLYTAGGNDGLIDGIRGGDNFRLGGWQGYQGVDFEAVIDLKSVKTIKNISTGFLQETSAWILMPRYVEYWVSDDGHNFTKVATVNNSVPADDMTPLVQDLSASVATSGRYVKVYARNFGKLPDWHTSAGCDAYIFIDEIDIKLQSVESNTSSRMAPDLDWDYNI